MTKPDLPTVAVLMAVRNRAHCTDKCLSTLKSQLNPISEATLYVVDDGSTDATIELVQSRHPDVELIRGDGNLFWVGAMRVAEDLALKTDPDYLIWVNDDAELFEGAAARLLETAREFGDQAIVCAAMRFHDRLQTSYSGVRTARPCLGLGFTLEPVEPAATAQLVDSFNGNFVLIPRSVVDQIGGIDPGFTHKWADFDYGLRARAAGIDVLLAAGHFGLTDRNTPVGTFLDPALPRRQRLQMLFSPKGFRPREKARYLRRHGGKGWLLQYLAVYAMYLVRIAVGR